MSTAESLSFDELMPEWFLPVSRRGGAEGRAAAPVSVSRRNGSEVAGHGAGAVTTADGAGLRKAPVEPVANGASSRKAFVGPVADGASSEANELTTGDRTGALVGLDSVGACNVSGSTEALGTGVSKATSAELSVPQGVQLLREIVSRIDSAQLGPRDGLTALVRDLTGLITQVNSLKLAAVAAADAAEVAGFSGAVGTGAWLADLTHGDERTAVAEATLANSLSAGDAPATKDALGEGRVSTEHAAVIVNALSNLPSDITDEERTRAERELLRHAERVSPGKLRRLARRAVEHAGRSTAEADAHQGKLLQSEEERALSRCRFALHDNADGTATGSFTVPVFAANVLRKVLEQMTAPRRQTPEAAGKSAMNWAHRKGLAFADLLERLPTDRLNGKVAATVVVTVEHEKLRSEVGAASLDTGHDLSAAQVRRIACGAGILPLVLDGASQILDLGRMARFFTEAQRTALATRYDECAAEGCDRPYAWTELHHEDPWHPNGRTDLDRAVPLCGYHHRLMHNPAYRATVSTIEGKKSVRYTRRT
jgi:hypothetical protein